MQSAKEWLRITSHTNGNSDASAMQFQPAFFSQDVVGEIVTNAINDATETIIHILSDRADPLVIDAKEIRNTRALPKKERQPYINGVTTAILGAKEVTIFKR